MTKFLITALVAGTLMGLAFAGTDLLNPHTASAPRSISNFTSRLGMDRLASVLAAMRFIYPTKSNPRWTGLSGMQIYGLEEEGSANSMDQ